MTFRDTPVIMGGEANDGADDVLENIELQSSFKQKMILMRQKNKQGEGAPQGKVLPQYDEEGAEELEVKKRNRIVLAGDGEAGRTKEQMLEEVREKLSFKGMAKVSLEVSKVSFKSSKSYRTLLRTICKPAVKSQHRLGPQLNSRGPKS